MYQPRCKTPRSVPKLTREKTTLSHHSDSSDVRHRDPVHVFCRLKPVTDELENTCIKLVSPTTLVLTSPSDAKVLRKDIQYVFNHVFTAYSGQHELFSHVAFPLLEGLLKGKNGLLFTYGVTGSGKTYTLNGDQSNPGIMPRCVDSLFNTIGELQAPKFLIKSDKMNGFEIQTESDAMQDRVSEAKANARKCKSLKRTDSAILFNNDGTSMSGANETSLYAVFVSYIEIYNNTVFDLLDESSGKVLQAKIIREDCNKNMYINGVLEVEVKSSVEAFEVLNLGQKRKRMAHTVLNAESSRSHSIFNIRLVQLEKAPPRSDGRPLIPEQNLIKVGQLSLVDLAGSERLSRTQNTGMRLKEASSINNSLMSLRTCLEILRENQMTSGNRLVPYRDSRLTLLFKNYFEGEGQVRMIVCANPSIQDYEENMQVLKFAEMTQDVKVTRPEGRYTPYKKTPRIAPTTPITTSTTKKAAYPFSLPAIPITKIAVNNIEATQVELERLIKVLRMRREKGEAIDRECRRKEASFRKRLVEMHEENLLGSSEGRSLKAILKREQNKMQGLQSKVVDLETEQESLEAKNEELHEIIRTLQNNLDEKDLKLNQNLLERERNKQKLAMETLKMSQELDDKLRHQRAILDAALKAKDVKLMKVKAILDTEAAPPAPVVDTAYEPHRSPAKLEETMHRRSGGGSARKRRSRSVDGEVWLEHNAIRPVPLGTVMKPSMRKRKSVGNLNKATDITNSKQNKYCLVAQEQDCNGDVETKLYKADIVSTTTGGAQVIFNDVERLRQESPTASP